MMVMVSVLVSDLIYALALYWVLMPMSVMMLVSDLMRPLELRLVSVLVMALETD